MIRHWERILRPRADFGRTSSWRILDTVHYVAGLFFPIEMVGKLVGG